MSTHARTNLRTRSGAALPAADEIGGRDVVPVRTRFRSKRSRRRSTTSHLLGRIASTGTLRSDTVHTALEADLPGRRSTLQQARSDRRRFRRHRLFTGWKLAPADYPLLAAIPVVFVLAGFLLSYLGLFDFYVRRTGIAVPTTAARDLIERTEPTGGRGGGEPLSIDATVFTQIRRIEYTVQPGDTISEIAYRFGLEPGTILSMNPVDDVRRLLPGTKLSIPDRDGLFHAVQPNESLWSIAESYGVPLAGILDANDIGTEVLDVGDTLFIPGAEMDSDDYLLAIGELFQWPVRSFSFTSGYGMRTDPITGEWRMHSGIDLANATGTPILAARSGRIVHVEPNSGNYGNLIIIDHGDGFRSLYAHLSSFTVASGQWVNTGQTIGRIGNTGRSTGPHLHFSVIRNGRWEDPLKHLP
ncbi:MAG: peptidoglycan DD-metalloendopeptidase family protein [Spirochaetota bacterium]